MRGFVMLWQKTLDSSIWRKQSKEARLVWMTMLMMKDSEGMIQASEIGLADRARVSQEECREALRIFLSPDPDDTSGVEDGRKIRKIQEGWQIVNHDLYRFSTEAKREFWRIQKEEQRARDKLEEMTPKQKASFEVARKKEYSKRRRNCKHDGAIVGARQANADGKNEQDQSLANGEGQ